ncbi:MAG: acyl-CoA thioesterase [Oleiphilaceae bacterium]|nr:acyl-CoA thioesterase [Oleiphilaceae bacterium]
MPTPSGQLMLQIQALPRDTNAHGDIYAGWLIQQMDLAAAACAGQISKGRATTVAMERIEFMSPVSVGDHVSCYTDLLDTGRSSMKIKVEVYVKDSRGENSAKVTEGVFIYVAINEMGGIRTLPNRD